MNDITQEEFEILWNIEYAGQTDPERASNGTSKDIKKQIDIFLDLEKKGLIKIERRDNQIYGATTTKESRLILQDKKYDNWIPE